MVSKRGWITYGPVSLLYPQCCPIRLYVIWPCLKTLVGSADKESACNAGDLGLIPGLGRSPGEGKGYPLQYFGLGCKESDTTKRLSLSLSRPSVLLSELQRLSLNMLLCASAPFCLWWFPAAPHHWMHPQSSSVTPLDYDVALITMYSYLFLHVIFFFFWIFFPPLDLWFSQWQGQGNGLRPAASAPPGDLFAVVQSLSHVQFFLTPWTAAPQASLSSTVSWNLLKFMSTESVMPSSATSFSFFAFSLSQHQGLIQWVCSLHHVAKVLEHQLQHQSLQWLIRVDFL